MGKFYTSKKKRLAQVAANNLGIIVPNENQRMFRGDAGGFDSIGKESKLYRNKKLHELDLYYQNKQYDDLQDWEEACCAEDYVKIRDRKPRIVYGFSKMLAQRIASKLVGLTNFPKLKVDAEPDDSEYIRMVIKAANLRSKMIEPIRKMCALGSSFVRYYIIDSKVMVKNYNPKYCYPIYSEDGDLEQVSVRYVFTDENDKDTNGTPRKKWFQIVMNRQSDILFDNPPYQEGVDPTFKVTEQVDHESGFVQGEWFRTSEENHSPDGYSLTEDILDFIDEINYSLSQSSHAVSYNQDPQILLNEMDEDEMNAMIRSSEKAWNLGKNGKAAFLESDLGGVQTATELRDKIRLGIQDVARIALLDPEKMVASAQSGEAMKVLHGPMVELINELRPMVEQGLINLVSKISISILQLRNAGIADTPVTIPPGWEPKSLDISADWPEVFPMTIEDLAKKVSVANTATSGQFLSRETAMRWLAKEFGIEDVEEELAKIAAQPVINPFGGF